MDDEKVNKDEKEQQIDEIEEIEGLEQKEGIDEPITDSGGLTPIEEVDRVIEVVKNYFAQITRA